MLLTVSKRLEFSASRRLFIPGWSETANLAAFGRETGARHGTGRNYVAYFIFAGSANPQNGMLINISEIKERAGEVIQRGFDHKFLNRDNPAFAATPPVAENVAMQLLREVEKKFQGESPRLVACHLVESPERSATAYADGSVDANYWFQFSAARRTHSPNLSEAENKELFAEATALHGHNYSCRVSLRADKHDPAEPVAKVAEVSACFTELRDLFDHKDLNTQVAELKGLPITTETLAVQIRKIAGQTLPVRGVRLHEREDFFAEAWADGEVCLGLRDSFSAAHRLHVTSLSGAENISLYGKCNNPLGHGHQYLVEATVGGQLDSRSGTLGNFVELKDALSASVEPWRDRHLDAETEDFAGEPSTGENIVGKLWPRLAPRVGDGLVRLRLWETPNNKFTLRRSSSFPPKM